MRLLCLQQLVVVLVNGGVDDFVRYDTVEEYLLCTINEILCSGPFFGWTGRLAALAKTAPRDVNLNISWEQ